MLHSNISVVTIKIYAGVGCRCWLQVLVAGIGCRYWLQVLVAGIGSRK